MLKMFVVVMVLGQVYGVAGPLDYTMEQCPMVLSRVADMVNMVLAKQQIEFHGRVVMQADVTTKCVMATQAPKAPNRFRT